MGTAISEQPLLAREEWDFSRVEFFEREMCMRYEYAREITDPQSYFLSSESWNGLEVDPFLLNRNKPVAPVEATVFAETKLTKKHTDNAFWRKNPSPWVSAGDPYKEFITGLYFNHPDGCKRAFPPELKTVPWIALDHGWRKALALCFNHFHTGFRRHDEAHFSGETKFEVEGHVFTKSGAEIVSVRINWDNDDGTLAEDFRKWLLIARPDFRQPKSNPGRQSTLTDALNSLAAMRLRHRYTASEATDVTRAELGNALYSSPYSWDRAANRAGRVFEVLYPGAKQPHSAERKPNPRGRPPLTR